MVNMLQVFGINPPINFLCSPNPSFMKFKLLLIFIVSLLISCTGEDDVPATVEKDLASTIAYTYFNGNVVARIETYFAENKPSQMLFYSGSSLDKKYVYTYGTDGQVTELHVYNRWGNLAVTSEYEYDDLGRIISLTTTDAIPEDMEWGSDLITYIHNNDNTVTLNRFSPEGTLLNQLTYHINSSGKIYKSVQNGETTGEFEYDGDDIIAFTSGISHFTYSYDEDNEVKGHYLNFFRNQMPGYELNYVIVGSFTSALSSTAKYMVGQDNTNGPTDATYEFEFDSDGYPVRKKVFTGDVEPNLIIDITYQ